MKKILFILTALLCVTFYAEAQHYKGDLSAFYGFKTSDIGADNYGIQTTHGYSFNKYLFVGAGVGFLKYNGVEKAVIPVYLDVKGYLNNQNRISPYISMDLGYGIRDGGGAYFAPGIGVNFRLYRQMGISVGIEYQSVQVDFLRIGNIALKVGFNF